MKLLTYEYFGLPMDPWAGFKLNTADSVRAAQLVRAAAQVRAFVSIEGPRGAGKTRAVRMALAGAGARVVEPLRLQRERLHLGDIETAIVRDLSDEAPRRSGEARSGQVRRILRAAGSRSNVLLLIDDAHVLHHATLRGLKRLRELGGRDRHAAIGVVLVGQSDRTARVPEIGLRSDRMRFAGLTVPEAKQVLHHALNRHTDVDLIGGREIDALASSPRARNWLDLEALGDDCLAEAQARGLTRIDGACVGAILNPGDHRARPAKAAQAASDAAVGDVLRNGRQAAA